jgi:hypothetical protein
MLELFTTIENNFAFIKEVCAHKYNDISQKVMTYINTFNIEQTIFDICFFGNRSYENVRKWCVYLYDNYSLINKSVNYIHYGSASIIAYAQQKRIEPMSKSWSCVSAIIKSYYTYKDFNYRYNELYDFEQPVASDKMVFLYNNIYTTVKTVVETETTVAEALITYKHDNKIIHRICNSKKAQNETEISKIVTELSDVKFLSIEYHSRDYVQPIVLELDKNEYLINNEILSCSFIKRLLEYQTAYNKFDKNYTVVIMDNNLRKISLNFGEYIVLHKTYYTIMNETETRENIYKDRNEVVSEISKEMLLNTRDTNADGSSLSEVSNE